MSSRKLRVLLAEDHVIVREGLCRLVSEQADMEVVGEAEDGREAARLALELLPDVVVMDVSMPEWDGLRSTEEVRKTCPQQVRVIALTRHNDYRYVTEMMGAGAAGYVLKQSASEELLRAIRAVAAGQTYIDPGATDRSVEEQAEEVGSRRAAKEAEPENEQVDVVITEQEREVLRQTVLGQSTKEIAAHLSESVQEVEAQRAAVMRKLGLKSRIDMVRYARRRGWVSVN